jgi:predicted amidohydrolase YtcJ
MLVACTPAVEEPASNVTTEQSTSTTARTTTSTPSTVVAADPADMVIHGGQIITMDETESTAQAVAIRGNEIVAVGSEGDMATVIGPDTVVVDLAGRTLIPGFVDAHSHYYGAALTGGDDPLATQELLLTTGVTTVGEAAVDEALLAEIQRLESEGLIQVRTSAYLLVDTACGDLTGDWQFDFPPTREPGERLRIGGIKLYTDGGSCNAPAVSFEHGFGGNGDLYFDAGMVADLIEPYDEAGYQVAIHALGDRAVEATLDGLEMVIGDSGNPLRHRLEHNAVVRPEMRARYDEVGAVAVIFGAFGTCAYLGRDDRFRFSTPIANQEWEWPWRDLLDMNPSTVFAWHGDFPVFGDSGPIASLSGFVTRSQTLADGTHCDPEPYHVKHSITVEEALQIMTAGAAYALDRDTEVGTIETGKLADLVVLSDNPLAIPPEELIDLSVELTVLDGKPVHCGDDFTSLCGRSVPEPDGGTHASASLPTNPPEFAFDGDLETHWSSGGDAPQWIEIELESEQTVTLVRLVVDQYPPGLTKHVIWGRTGDGELIQLAEFSGETDMFDVLEIGIDEPVPVTAIRIETRDSPSWVAWREIEIAGS